MTPFDPVELRLGLEILENFMNEQLFGRTMQTDISKLDVDPIAIMKIFRALNLTTF